jgi:hypothetical protein
MSAYVALAGTVIVFVGAYLVEKARGMPSGRALFQFLAMMPMAVPGLVLGLAYIFFFNDPDNPLNPLYRTMAILVVNTIAHFYTVAHLTAVTAFRQMDPEFEAVSASLKQPFYRTFWRVTVPVCLPAILDVGILPLRQRHDDGFGRRLPVGTWYRAGIDRRPRHGRRGTDGGGGRHGDDDLLHERGCPDPSRRAGPLVGAADTGLAPEVTHARPTARHCSCSGGPEEVHP